MNIVLDITSLVTPRLTGVGVYEKQLLEGCLASEMGPQIQPVIKWTRWHKRKLLLRHVSEEIFALTRPWHPLRELPWSKKVVFHGPDCRLIGTPPGMRIVTVHDLQPFFDEWWEDLKTPTKMRYEFRQLVESKPDHFIVPTASIKSDLIKFFPNITEDSISVIAHGADHIDMLPMTNTPNSKLLTLGLQRNSFILCLGTLELRKNQGRLIQAYAHLVRKNEAASLSTEERRNPLPPLVLAGGTGHGAASMLKLVENEIAFLEAKGLLQILGPVTDSEKSWLLANCQFFAYPSLYEGFGIPLIEAMKAGKPILTSNYGAMAEVLCHSPLDSTSKSGSGGILINPRSYLDMASGLEEGLRLESIDWSDHLSKFTWLKSVSEHLKVYSDTCQKLQSNN